MKFKIFLIQHLFSILFMINNALICTTFNLTVIHNNDFHTHYSPINTYGFECKSGEECFGGVARTVTKVNEIRNESSNTLFLNAGDHYQGTVWYTFQKWKVVAKFVKLMRHDAMALGNHEFDDGVDGLMPFIRNMTDLLIISCNIDVSNEPKLKDSIKPSIIREFEGKKIAIIGYTTPDTIWLSKPGPTVIFNDEVVSIRNEIKNLRIIHGNSLNIFIAVGHSGIEKDKEIAAKIEDLDIVVGGHSHTFLFTGNSLPSTEKLYGKYPLVFDHGVKGKTLVVQAYANGKYIGKLDTEFDENGIIVKFGGNPILLDSNTAEDPKILDQVKEVAQQIKDKSDYVIGSTFVPLSKLCDKECNIGNVIADAFVYSYIKSTRKQKLSWTSTSIAIINRGSIRNSISVGNITLENIVSTSPFGNKVGILTANGSLLWQILEHSGSKFGGFLQVSGLRIEYDLNQPIGRRLRKVRVRCTDCLIPQYEDIDLSNRYAIVMTDYIAFGGSNYSMIDPKDFSVGSETDYEIFANYVKSRSPIYTGIEDRILFISGNPLITSIPGEERTTNPLNLALSNKINASFMINSFIILSLYLTVYWHHF